VEQVELVGDWWRLLLLVSIIACRVHLCHTADMILGGDEGSATNWPLSWFLSAIHLQKDELSDGTGDRQLLIGCHHLFLPCS
jgi:hypothetical protein